ncbi:MAG: succinate dehydrogenase iron-sulfur subunit [Nitrospinae bacterium]|nr:succinate dehydrogenase iron-sulfur subunit [Nitrospinota bacterium]
MTATNVTFKVFRFDPEKDTEGRYQDYTLAVAPGETILNCVNRIKWEQDQTLAHRFSCGSAICGSCAMKINGHATLVCKTQAMDKVKDGVIRIDPIGNLKPLRDLVVDLTPFWKSFEKVEPWLAPDAHSAPEKERLQTPEQFAKIDNSTTCIMCAACFSDCNVLEVDKRYYGPATLAKAHRFIFDSRDARTEARLRKVTEETGVWDCTHCGECSTRCPTETKPLARINEIRQAAMKAGMHDTSGARHVLGFRETVGKRGLLDENYVPIRSVGFFNLAGLLSLAPVGLRMLARGKNPPFIPHSIEKAGEVRAIFAKREELNK